MGDTDVLIVGAGPTGLALALWLAALGVRFRIIDKNDAPGLTSRALAVQARTLELYRQLGLDSAVIARGHKVPAINMWSRGQRRAHVNFENIGAGLTPYSFMMIFPQDEHEKLLVERLRQFGIEVERQTELTEFIEERGAIAARLRKADGSSELCKAKYLAGCDGARSLVRESLKLGFPGGTYHHVFYVADVEGSGAAIDGELHIDLDDADFLAVFPLAGAGRARFVGSTRDVSPEDSAKLSFAGINKRAIEQMKLAVDKVNWFSTYHVHHRVVDHFRQGRAFLLGDAAHIHSPVGGQGMNTGIGDAINLAWKLAATLGGKAPDSLLDSYEAERIAFARRLVATTDRVFNVVSSNGKLAGLVRTRIAPALLGSLISIGFVRNLLFRLVSQIELNYRGRPLSQGRAGAVQGGDRLAWVKTPDGDNHAPLSAMRWQAHIYGVAGGALVAWCKDRGLPLHVFAWRPEYAKAGLAQNALYLTRPDGYVALAEATADPAVVERYLTERGLRID